MGKYQQNTQQNQVYPEAVEFIEIIDIDFKYSDIGQVIPFAEFYNQTSILFYELVSYQFILFCLETKQVIYTKQEQRFNWEYSNAQLIKKKDSMVSVYFLYQDDLLKINLWGKNKIHYTTENTKIKQIKCFTIYQQYILTGDQGQNLKFYKLLDRNEFQMIFKISNTYISDIGIYRNDISIFGNDYYEVLDVIKRKQTFIFSTGCIDLNEFFFHEIQDVIDQQCCSHISPQIKLMFYWYELQAKGQSKQIFSQCIRINNKVYYLMVDYGTRGLQNYVIINLIGTQGMVRRSKFKQNQDFLTACFKDDYLYLFGNDKILKTRILTDF